MVRPLKDIVAELEGKYGFSLFYGLEDRHSIISTFDKDMENMFRWINHYEEDIKFILERKLDVSIIQRMTLNLALVMQRFCESLDDYEYAIERYLLDDRYEKNHDVWAAFVDTNMKLKDLFDRLLKNNVFEVDDPDEINVCSRAFYGYVEYDSDGAIIFDDNRYQLWLDVVERMNGAELIICVKRLLQYFNERFGNIKNSGLKWSDRRFTEVYEQNYLLYAELYWPNQEKNFRNHVERQLLRGRVDVNGLERLRQEVVRDFENNTNTGRIWRDYSEDIPLMASQMKEQKLNEEQWKYFFQNIFEIEELDRWIEELQNPPESEEDKQKRERLLKSNKVFNLHPANQKKPIDILLLYQFIETRFITDEMHFYEWFALYYVLKKNGILKVRLAAEFAKQMNHEEWFGHVKKNCSEKAIKDYEFLEEAEPGHWVVNIRKTSGARVSKKSIDTIQQRYEYLSDCLDEIFMDEIPIERGGYTIINYGNYNDVHGNNTVNL